MTLTMTAICTCMMHCPKSAYHERACCGQTTCDCWCHRREDARATEALYNTRNRERTGRGKTMTPSLFGRDGHHFIADPDSPDTCRRCRRPKAEHAPAETAAMAAGPMTFAVVTRAERARLAEELLPNGRVWGR